MTIRGWFLLNTWPDYKSPKWDPWLLHDGGVSNTRYCWWTKCWESSRRKKWKVKTTFLGIIWRNLSLLLRNSKSSSFAFTSSWAKYQSLLFNYGKSLPTFVIHYPPKKKMNYKCSSQYYQSLEHCAKGIKNDDDDDNIEGRIGRPTCAINKYFMPTCHGMEGHWRYASAKASISIAEVNKVVSFCGLQLYWIFYYYDLWSTCVVWEDKWHCTFQTCISLSRNNCWRVRIPN